MSAHERRSTNACSPIRNLIGRCPSDGGLAPARPPGRAMGDKACSSAANRAYLRRRIQAVIPVKEDQQTNRCARSRPPAFDATCYSEGNTVERCFAKLKQFCAVATRYGKRELTHQGTLDTASIRV